MEVTKKALLSATSPSSASGAEAAAVGSSAPAAKIIDPSWTLAGRVLRALSDASFAAQLLTGLEEASPDANAAASAVAAIKGWRLDVVRRLDRAITKGVLFSLRFYRVNAPYQPPFSGHAMFSVCHCCWVTYAAAARPPAWCVPVLIQRCNHLLILLCSVASYENKILMVNKLHSQINPCV